MVLGVQILCSVLFLLTHLGLSHGPIRERLVASLGLWPFRGLYSLVSFATLGPAAVLWWTNRHLGPLLFELPWWLERALAVPLMLLAVELLVLGFANPSPVSMVPTRPEPRGVLRVTRHPMNMGFALFGLAHLLANGTLGDVAFFGCCFLGVGVLGAWHQDRRIARSSGEGMDAFRRQTSILPLVAVLLRRTRLDPGELPWPMVILAALIWAALLLLHGRLFGAPLLS